MYFYSVFLRIKGLYMIRALLVHLQEALGIMRVCYVSWLHQDISATLILVQPTEKQARSIPRAVCLSPPEDEQVMLEIYIGP
jgi:hypothetical protein